MRSAVREVKRRERRAPPRLGVRWQSGAATALSGAGESHCYRKCFVRAKAASRFACRRSPRHAGANNSVGLPIGSVEPPGMSGGFFSGSRIIRGRYFLREIFSAGLAAVAPKRRFGAPRRRKATALRQARMPAATSAGESHCRRKFSGRAKAAARSAGRHRPGGTLDVEGKLTPTGALPT